MGSSNKKSDVTALNRALVQELKQDGYVHDPAVEAAFRAVPRHLFLPELSLDQVYSNEAITTKELDGIAISSSSQPAMMAIMLEQLALAPGHRVLEIGAGTGYNAALMSHLVGSTGQVVTMDIDDDIVAEAREHLGAAGCENVTVVCGDGGAGYPDLAPYDRIILTVGAWDITPAWREQLQPQGRLVLPLSFNGPQKSIAFEWERDHFVSRSVVDCLFMRLRGESAAPEALVHLGNQPGLVLGGVGEGSVDAEAIYQGLAQPYRDQSTHVPVTRRELFNGLALWLALRQPGFCRLSALGEAVSRQLVPYLFGLEGKSCVTFGVIRGASQCWLMRPSDQLPPLERETDTAAFELWLRCFGPEGGIAERLIEQIQAWVQAGRPSTEGMRVRAYPRETAYESSGHELMVVTPSMQFVLDWPG